MGATLCATSRSSTMLAMATSLVGMAQSLASIWSALTSCPPSSRQARVTRSWAASCSIGVRRSSCGVGMLCPSRLEPLSGRTGASYAHSREPDPDPKIHDEQAGGSTRRSAAEPGPSSWLHADSGGGFEGDLVAEGFELADVVALGALSVEAGVVEAGAQVLEPCGRVGQ